MAIEPTANSQEAPFSMRVRVGTMGWSYADWNGVFYPANAVSRDTLTLYARNLDVVEIDSTFYGTPRETTVQQWRKATPENFIFCPKVPRLITHDLGLLHAEEPLAHFVRVMSLLGPKRGPMLLQMPPSFTRAELPALQAFLPLLPQLNDPAARFAIEFRNRSLIGADVSNLLAEFNVALTAADYPGMPKRLEKTADFTYLRLIGRHGAFEQHRELQADRSADIQKWADALLANQSHFSAAYLFCNNDYEGYGPGTCSKVKISLGLPIHQSPPEIQGSLF